MRECLRENWLREGEGLCAEGKGRRLRDERIGVFSVQWVFHFFFFARRMERGLSGWRRKEGQAMSKRKNSRANGTLSFALPRPKGGKGGGFCLDNENQMKNLLHLTHVFYNFS